MHVSADAVERHRSMCSKTTQSSSLSRFYLRFRSFAPTRQLCFSSNIVLLLVSLSWWRRSSFCHTAVLQPANTGCGWPGRRVWTWSHMLQTVEKSDFILREIRFLPNQIGQKPDLGLQHEHGLSLANSVVGNGSSRKYGSCSDCSEVIRLVGSIVRSFWS